MDPLTCATCGKKFKRKQALRQHTRIHTGERPFACFYCDKTFKRKDHARRHMVSHTKNTLQTFTCNVEGCGKVFKLERVLKRHFDTAHDTPFKCTFDGCELAFNKKYKMKKHRSTHNDGKVLKCTVEGCTSMFARRKNLLRHLECHEREFKCRVLGCDVVVKSWSELRKHLKGHKKVHCKQCDVVCPNKSTFQKHCRDAHPVPKKTKFDCPYDGCSKIYSRGSNLNAHIRTEHDGQRFYCTREGCDRVFRQNVNLKKHIASHETTTKKTKKKRRRKSLAAKLARYNGELCDLPVTYVDPDDSDASTTSASTETPLTSEECCDVTKEPSCSKKEEEEKRPPALHAVQESSLSLCSASASNSLVEELQMVINDGHYHISGAKHLELCSMESNSETQDSLKENRQVLECAASS